MLTREKALEKHREMWEAMQKELGDCPGAMERLRFKARWCEEHGEGDTCNHCYLCQYTLGIEYIEIDGCLYVCCDHCPIDWGRNVQYGCERENEVNYRTSPISEILALPERKVSEDGVVAETES